MERLSACELLDRNDRQSGNINPDSAGLCSTWPRSTKADAWLARAIGLHCRRPALRGPLSQLEAIVWLWKGRLRSKRLRCVDSRRFRFTAAPDSDIVGSSDFFFFFFFYL